MVDGSPKGLASARYKYRRTMACPERILAMKPGFALPVVGSAVSRTLSCDSTGAAARPTRPGHTQYSDLHPSRLSVTSQPPAHNGGYARGGRRPGIRDGQSRCASSRVRLLSPLTGSGLNGAFEVVAHAGDLPPRDRRLRGQQVSRQRFDSFADLQQADADRVEDQPSGRSPRCSGLAGFMPAVAARSRAWRSKVPAI
jgi:hypothetical protein